MGMQQHLRGLLSDLARYGNELARRAAAVPADAWRQQRAREAGARAARAAGDIETLLRDPDLAEPSLLRNHLQTYKRTREELNLLDWHVITLLERFDERDQRMSEVCRRLCHQIGWPTVVPLIGTYSSEHYWTASGVIYVPASEAASLLGLSDLGHELGHVLLASLPRVKIWRNTFAASLSEYLDELRARLRRDGVLDNYAVALASLTLQWRDSWWHEFSADVIATYLMGSAYGWQHIKLCMSRSLAFAPGLEEEATHPADDARFRIVCYTLEVFGRGELSLPAQRIWSAFLDTSAQRPPADYEMAYPDRLLHTLVDQLVPRLRALGLRAFVDAGPAPDDIVALLIRAWDQFRADPETYPTWEAGERGRLYGAPAIAGVGTPRPNS